MEALVLKARMPVLTFLNQVSIGDGEREQGRLSLPMQGAVGQLER